MYKVYWADKPPGPELVVRKDQLARRQYRRLDDALGWARRVREEGGIAWLIEGDGTRLNRDAIVDALGRSEHAQPAPGALAKGVG